MVRSTLIIVSDDQNVIVKTQQFAQSIGLNIQTWSSEQWESLRSNQGQGASLVAGRSGESAKVLHFPAAGNHTTGSGGADPRQGVATMNQLESVAIENAIQAFRGNLTEAARALGIGRATLYRKVKQYNIDPSAARKKKAA